MPTKPRRIRTKHPDLEPLEQRALLSHLEVLGSSFLITSSMGKTQQVTASLPQGPLTSNLFNQATVQDPVTYVQTWTTLDGYQPDASSSDGVVYSLVGDFSGGTSILPPGLPQPAGSDPTPSGSITGSIKLELIPDEGDLPDSLSDVSLKVETNTEDPPHNSSTVALSYSAGSTSGSLSASPSVAGVGATDSADLKGLPFNTPIQLNWSFDATGGAGSFGSLDLGITPTLDIAAKYNTPEAGANVIGRFFRGVPIPDENATITVLQQFAQSGAASVTATLGGSPLAVTKTGKGTYTTANFDPSTYANGTALKVSLTVNGELVATKQETLDVEPQPPWFIALNGKATFDTGSEVYTFNASLLDSHTSSSDYFSLHQVPGLWFGGGAKSGLDATIAVTAQTGLDPTEDPSVDGNVKVDLTFMGKSVYAASFDSDQQDGPFVLGVTLDPRTLALQSGDVSYSETRQQKIDLFKNDQFKTANFTALSGVGIDLTETMDLNLSINADGTFVPGQVAADGSLSGSRLSFDLKGDLSGKLLDLDFTSVAEARAILGVARRFLGATTPIGTILGSIATELAKDLGLLPSLSMQSDVTGSIELSGAVQLTGQNSGRLLYFDPSVDLSLTPPTLDLTWLGNTYEVAVLPSLFNGFLTISYHPKKP
ncbi:hypothetical protein [Aquisphaera giovannonii]|nr:hypothetical protein [Aquisphaera giovannonii]